MAAKNSKKKHKKKGFTLPIAVVAGFVPGLIKVWEAWPAGPSAAAREAGQIYTGVDFWNGTFNFGKLWYGLLPILAGGVVHRFVGGRLGVNRALASAGIPIIRL